MYFETIKRDEILPMIEQAKDKKEQKKILCDLLGCTMKELEALIRELKAERKKSENDETVKAAVKKVAESDELTEIASYAKKLEGELAAKDKELDEIKAELEKERDAAAAKEDQFAEEIEAAWAEADSREKANEELKETQRRYAQRIIKSENKAEMLSAALSKSLEFIASLNAVIAEVLKA